MHGGTIVACSDGDGQGSEFVVRLLVADAAEPEARPRRSIAKLRSGAKIIGESWIGNRRSLRASTSTS
jgi:hypothetical protein